MNFECGMLTVNFECGMLNSETPLLSKESGAYLWIAVHKVDFSIDTIV